ncbi:hypothetical protein V6R21_24725 [Limibacter armeniacum]|uniref:hypothetical protein n=1 Tax=Limibacter armeniacum TaxID=466084 RepID=UPI002FE54433
MTMIRTLFFILLTFLSTNLFAQELLWQKPIKLSSGVNDKREAYALENKEKGELLVFLMDNQSIYLSVLDEEVNTVNEFIIDRPLKKYTTLLGGCIEGNDYTLFFLEDRKTSLCIVTINAEANTSKISEMPYQMPKETFLEAFTYNNEMFLLNIEHKSSRVKVYNLTKKGFQSFDVVDFEDQLKTMGQEKDLSRLLESNKSLLRLTLSPKIKKVDNHMPNSIEVVGAEHKLYVEDSKVWITLDHEEAKTIILSFDLNEYVPRGTQVFHRGITAMNPLALESNSFYQQGKLYQVVVSSDEMCLSVTDLVKGVRLKEHRVKKDDEISFKNSPLVQEGGSTIFSQGSKRELTKTRKILRKMVDSKPGVSVYPMDNYLEVTIGSYKEMKGNAPMMGGFGPGIPAGNFFYSASFSFSVNYTMTKATYFKSIFEKESFEHINGNIQMNAFDKAKEFTDKYGDQVSKAQTIFRWNDYYLLGYYMNGTYDFRKFTDSPQVN